MATSEFGTALRVGHKSASWIGYDPASRVRTSHFRFIRNVLIATDVVLLVISAVIAFGARFFFTVIVRDEATFFAYAKRHFGFLLLYSALVILFAHTRRLYVQPRRKLLTNEIAEILKSVCFAGVVLGCAIYFSGQKTVSREVVAVTVVLSSVFLISWRVVLRRHRVAGLMEARNTLIVGAGPLGHSMCDYLESHPEHGRTVVGFLDNDKWSHSSRNDSKGVAVLGAVEEFAEVARSHFVDDVLVTVQNDRELVKWISLEAKRAGISVRVVPDLFDGLAIGAPIELVGQFPTMALYQEPIPAGQLFFKRLLDIVCSVLALIVLSPLMLLISAMVWMGSEGPIFYRSSRVGKKGRTFTCFKFRTMVADADAIKEQLKHLNERTGVLFKISDDPRITRLGRFLRKYSLDELPQFWNVLKGDMSIVGPRPPIPDEFSQYALEHLRRLDVTPGITGLWQVQARQSPSFEDYIDLDLQYVENWSVWLDLKLIARTLKVVVAGTGQ